MQPLFCNRTTILYLSPVLSLSLCVYMEWLGWGNERKVIKYSDWYARYTRTERKSERERERESEMYYINTRYMGDEYFFYETVFHALLFLSIASHSAGHILNETVLLLPLLLWQRQRLPLLFDRLNNFIRSFQNRSKKKTLGDKKKEKQNKTSTTNNLKVLNKYICFGINCNPYFHCLIFFHIELCSISLARSPFLSKYLKILFFIIVNCELIVCFEFVFNLISCFFFYFPYKNAFCFIFNAYFDSLLFIICLFRFTFHSFFLMPTFIFKRNLLINFRLLPHLYVILLLVCHQKKSFLPHPNPNIYIKKNQNPWMIAQNRSTEGPTHIESQLLRQYQTII